MDETEWVYFLVAVIHRSNERVELWHARLMAEEEKGGWKESSEVPPVALCIGAKLEQAILATLTSPG